MCLKTNKRAEKNTNFYGVMWTAICLDSFHKRPAKSTQIIISNNDNDTLGACVRLALGRSNF